MQAMWANIVCKLVLHRAGGPSRPEAFQHSLRRRDGRAGVAADLWLWLREAAESRERTADDSVLHGQLCRSRGFCCCTYLLAHMHHSVACFRFCFSIYFASLHHQRLDEDFFKSRCHQHVINRYISVIYWLDICRQSYRQDRHLIKKDTEIPYSSIYGLLSEKNIYTLWDWTSGL